MDIICSQRFPAIILSEEDQEKELLFTHSVYDVAADRIQF